MPIVLTPGGTALLLPGREAGEFLVCRRAATALPDDVSPEATTRQTFPSLESAAASLTPDDTFVVTLPIETGLVQRMALPAAEPSELEEMARIQLEKILPYPAEVVNVAVQEVSRTETDVVLAVQSAHQDRIAERCDPFIAQDCWPRRVAFLALLMANSAPTEETTAFLYREAGKYVVGISEGGKLSFAQALGGQSAEDLATELPAVLLGAELEGVPTAFQRVRLDERLEDWGETLATALGVPVALFDPEGAALSVAARPDGDLSPAHWQAERLRGERRVRLKQRLRLAAMVYGGLLLLAFVVLGVRKIQVARLDSQLMAIKPAAAYSRDANTRWRAMGSALEPGESLAEVMKYVYDCLPPGDTVLLTGFDYSDRGLAVQGEAPSSTAAVEYTEKLKALPQLRTFHLEAEQPTLQSNNGKWRFRVSTTAPTS